MTKIRFTIVGLFLLASLFAFVGCKPPAGAGVYIPGIDKEHILIFTV